MRQISMRKKISVLLAILVWISMNLMGLAVAAQSNNINVEPTLAKSTLDFSSTMIPQAGVATEKSDMQTAIDNYNAKIAAEEQRKAEEAARAQQEAQAAANNTSSGGGSGGGGEESYASGGGGGGEDLWGVWSSIVAQYPILEGTSVSYGDAQGYEAIAYYRSGTVIVNPNHTYPLYEILYHEAMHIIDWRSDGDIDNDDR